jgi:hypothetical protein
VQRRVDEPDRDRQVGHRGEDVLEVGLLHRQQLVQGGLPGGGGVRHDHAPHHGQAVRGHEHVLGAAQANALGSQLAGLRGVLARVGDGAHAQAVGRS